MSCNIDYTQQSVIQVGQQYDLILDAAAYRSVPNYRQVLSPEGAYTLVGGSTARLMRSEIQGTTNKCEPFNRLVRWLAFEGEHQVIGVNNWDEQRKHIYTIGNNHASLRLLHFSPRLRKHCSRRLCENERQE